jgi:hypothetical protein
VSRKAQPRNKISPAAVLSDEAMVPYNKMPNPQQCDDQEDPAAPTQNLDPLYAENELPATGSWRENQEITSLIENWIDS